MTEKALELHRDRPTAEYLVRQRDYRISETFSMRDARYAEVDSILRGEFGYKLPGDNLVIEPPMVMNLGLTFTNDIARLVPEQSPVYRAPIYGDDKSKATEAQVREVIADTYWVENRGDVLVPQIATDLAVCGAAYIVAWVEEGSEYPRFTRLDPRHCYPNIQNGNLIDLLVINIFPAQLAEAMFPGKGVYEAAQGKSLSGDVEVWQYYSEGYAGRWIAASLKGNTGVDASTAMLIDKADYDIDCPPVAYAQVASHDGAQRGMLDQLGNSLMAKNKIASLMAKYTEHKVFAPWEAKGILNPTDTPGPNTVYEHNENSPFETFMRRVDPAGSDPALFALMNLLDLDQRGGIGYPASRQGEVGQSIASAAFVESTQGQLSSIVKSIQMHEADMRTQLFDVLMKLDQTELDFEKPLLQAVGKKRSYTPSAAIKGKTRIRVTYGAGAGMSRQNADTRILNLMGARLIDRGTARENLGDFLRDRSDIQDKIEMENAEDSLQQLFWPDPNVPMDVKFQVKKLMTDRGLNLTDAYAQVQETLAQAQEAAAQTAAQRQAMPQEMPMPEGMEGEMAPTAAQDQAMALEKGQVVQEPADIELPKAPLEQIFINSEG